MTRKTPTIIDVTDQQLEEILARADSNTLREEDTQLLHQILDSYAMLFEVIADKNTTIARLRKLVFGASTEKAESLQGYSPANGSILQRHARPSSIFRVAPAPRLPPLLADTPSAQCYDSQWLIAFTMIHFPCDF